MRTRCGTAAYEASPTSPWWCSSSQSSCHAPSTSVPTSSRRRDGRGSNGIRYPPVRPCQRSSSRLSIAAQRNLPHRVVAKSQLPPFPRHSGGVAMFIDIAAEGARVELDLVPLLCAHFGESREQPISTNSKTGLVGPVQERRLDAVTSQRGAYWRQGAAGRVVASFGFPNCACLASVKSYGRGSNTVRSATMVPLLDHPSREESACKLMKRGPLARGLCGLLKVSRRRTGALLCTYSAFCLRVRTCAGRNSKPELKAKS